jgi:hypothetical protein
MIVNLFRHTQALSILSVFILSITMWSVLSYQEYSGLINGLSPLYEGFISPILNYSIIARILTGVFIFWQALMVNKLMIGQSIYSTNTFYPALLFVLISSASPQFMHLSPNFIALLFLIIALQKIINCYLAKNAHTLVFESAFLLSIAILIHPPYLLFIPLIWIGMSIFSLGEWRYWVLSILGLICPQIIGFTLGAYFKIQHLNFKSLFLFFEQSQVESQFSIFDLLSFSIYGIAILLALIEVIFSLKKKKIKARKSFVLILWLFLFQGLYLFLDPSPFSSKLQIVALPASIFISNYYYYKKTTTWIKASLYILVFTVLLHQFWV